MIDQERQGALGLVPEIKATAILSIRDSMRQRGLTIDEAAATVSIDPEQMRAIVGARQVHNVSVETLNRIVDALAVWERKP